MALLTDQGLFGAANVETSLQGGGCRVRIASIRWQHVLINLLSNAVQACGDDCLIRIESARVGDSYRLSISDNGRGIPADKTDAIFEPFFTLKETGRGLGLFVSLRTIEQAGGTIDVDSVELKGTCFVLTLPLSKDERQPSVR